jgi:hypothetical protein
MQTDNPLADSLNHITSQLEALSAAAPGFNLDSVTETLADWLASQYFLIASSAARDAASQSPPQPIPLETLRAITYEIALLRRGNQYREHLRLREAQLDLARQFTDENLDKTLLDWAKKPENLERLREIVGKQLRNRGLRPETLARIEADAKLL